MSDTKFYKIWTLLNNSLHNIISVLLGLLTWYYLRNYANVWPTCAKSVLSSSLRGRAAIVDCRHLPEICCINTLPHVYKLMKYKTRLIYSENSLITYIYTYKYYETSIQRLISRYFVVIHKWFNFQNVVRKSLFIYTWVC